MRPTFESIFSICSEFDCSGEDSPLRGWHGRVESSAHELAHCAVIGELCSSEKVDQIHHDLSAQASDAQEIAAGATEWLVLDALGLPVSTQRLAEYACRSNKWMKDVSAIKRAIERSAKTQRVHQAAELMLAWIFNETARYLLARKNLR